MQVSHPKENGVLPAGCRETLALRGRAHATITIALCEQGLFRYGLEMMYSYGGFGVPITLDGDAFSSFAAARCAAMDALLRHWPRAFSSEPLSVHEELQNLREQIECHLRQPSLF